jgi:single-stranded-DNA-specific exonuclease
LDTPDVARRFLDPRLAQLTPPNLMADRAVAAARLARAVKNHERICIFGDYDCDGITSAAIMTHALRKLGADVEVTLANRFEGGYGVSLPAVNRIRDKHPTLLVTCDCGSSDAESLRVLASSGIETIVIDHHLVPSDPLPAVAFLNPHRPDCGFQYKNLASCGLALSVVAALRAQLDTALDLHSYLDLVAIGTIADVAPLDGDNRILVRIGLQRIAEGTRPGLKALLDRAKLDKGAPITGEDVSFRIAPRLNAPGRLASPDVSLQLLLAEDTVIAEQLADQIERLQNERRGIQDKMLTEAHSEIETQGWKGEAGIVIGRETWSSGIVGILAGKLAEHYRIPVVAIGIDGEVGRGSVRGPAGFGLYDMLEGLSDCLIRFGGHQAAAGLEVRIDAIDTLRARFNAACVLQANARSRMASAHEVVALPIDSEDDLFQVARDLALFEPCGEGNRQPLLLTRGKVVKAREVRGGHLQLEIQTARGQKLRAFGFGLGSKADDLSDELGIVGTLRISRYQSVERAEMRIERLDQSEFDTSRPIAKS